MKRVLNERLQNVEYTFLVKDLVFGWRKTRIRRRVFQNETCKSLKCDKFKSNFDEVAGVENL